MIIVDSLLNFNFFLSGEVQKNLSLFASRKRQHTSQRDLRQTPPDTTWIRHTSDPIETWQKRHAAVFSSLPPPPAWGLFREPRVAERNLAGGAHDVWQPTPACTEPAADDDCPLG